MNRDKGIYNLTHAYHLALKMKINTTKISRTGSYGKKKNPAVLCLNHINISAEEAGCLAGATVDKNSKFSTVLTINLQFIDIYQTRR